MRAAVHQGSSIVHVPDTTTEQVLVEASLACEIVRSLRPTAEQGRNDTGGQERLTGTGSTCNVDGLSARWLAA